MCERDLGEDMVPNLSTESNITRTSMKIYASGKVQQAIHVVLKATTGIYVSG